jgi:GR25 family glycosyltransferase involved in LPS biosynthesis
MKKTLLFLTILLPIYALFHLSTTKSEKLDKIYIINLDRSIDRYSAMQNEIKAANFPLESTRFRAVDGKRVTFLNVATREKITGADILEKKLILKGEFIISCFEDKPDDVISVKLNWEEHHLRGVGEIGHTCSSRKIWQEIVTNGYQNVMIMEDDIHLIKGFTGYLTRAMNNAPQNYDYLYLNMWDHWSSYSYKKKIENKFLRFSLNIFDQYIRNIFWKRVRRNLASAKTYIVSQEGARKLLQYTQTMPDNILVADMTIAGLIEDDKIIAYTSKPQLTTSNDDFKSDVENL